MAITDYYVTTDAMGSVISVLDENGQVLERRSYDAFGKASYMLPDGTPVETSPTGVDIGFQGQLMDELTGMYQMGYRWYSPVLGRWVSRDPISLEGGVNLYGSCGNDMVSRLDPWGEKDFLVFIWEWRGLGVGVPGSSVGHVMIVDESAGEAVTSFFPHAPGGESAHKGPLHNFTREETMNEEKSAPDRIFKIHISSCKDKMVDEELLFQRGKMYWYASPMDSGSLIDAAFLTHISNVDLTESFLSKRRQEAENMLWHEAGYALFGTNCTYGAINVLQAGDIGVEMVRLPGNLGEALLQLGQSTGASHCDLCHESISIRELSTVERRALSGSRR